MDVRSQLLARLSSEISVGFVPAVSADADAFSFATHYLPLSNYLSQEMGVLVNFVPQRNMSKTRRDIANQKHPLLFLTAATTVDAVKAGYAPLAQLASGISASYIVKAESKFTKTEELKGAKFAWSSQNQAAQLAMGDLAKLNLVEGNQFAEIGADDVASAMLALDAHDVVVVTADVAKSMLASTKTKYRVIGESSKMPASVLWARKDLVDSEVSNRLVRALIEVGSSEQTNAKIAASGFSAGFKQPATFVLTQVGVVESMSVLFNAAEKAFPRVFTPVSADPKVLSANRALPVIRPVARSDVQDPSAYRARLQQAFRQQIAVGFAPYSSTIEDGQNFVAHYLPLANHLSQSSGVLVNFVPERNIDLFRKRIAEVRYPIIFASAVHSVEASKAGYVPLMQATDSVGIGYLVKKDSKIQRSGDIKGAKIGWSTKDQIAFLAMADLTKASAGSENTPLELGNSDASTAINAVRSGVVEVVALSSKSAEAAATASKGELRLVPGEAQVASTGMWVRKDLAGTDFARRLMEGLSQVTPGATGTAGVAAQGFQSGFGLIPGFAPVTEESMKRMTLPMDAMAKQFPGSFKDVQVNAGVKTINATSPAIQLREGTSSR